PPSALMNPLSDADWFYRLIGPFQILGHYARLTLFPEALSTDYGVNVVPLHLTSDALPLGMTLFGVLTAATLIWLLVGVRSHSETRRRAGFAALIFIAAFGLISNTVLLIGVAVAERVFYWPSVAALLLVALGLAGAWRKLARPGGALHDLRRIGA